MKKSVNNHMITKNYSKWFLIILSTLIPTVIFINRFLIPDFSFDTLYYHLFNGLRGVQNYFWIFSSKEFYPVGFGYVAPIYDVINYIFRELLGYRLGTIVDLLAYVGIIVVCYGIIDEFIDNFKKLHIAIKIILFLNVIIVTELLFQLATQYVDILDTFLVLFAIYLFLKYLKYNKNVYLWTATCLFSITLLAKATNYIYIIPFYAILVYYISTSTSKTSKNKIMVLFGAGVILAVPSLLYAFKNYTLSGNPFFPLLNNIFKSPYAWPISFSPSQSGVGGTTLTQKLLWPVASYWHLSRLAEPHNIFNDWKIGEYWLTAIVLFIPMLWKKMNRFEKYIVIYFLASIELWGIGTGVMRYATAASILGGIAVLIFCIKLLSFKKTILYIVLIPAILLIIVDDYRIVQFNLKYDMSWRPNLIHNSKLYLSQGKSLFDNQLAFSPSEYELINSSNIFLDCVNESSGLIALSGFNNKPVLSTNLEAPYEAITGEHAYRKKAAGILLSYFHNHNNELTFTTFAIKNLSVEYKLCLQSLPIMGAKINQTVPLNSFLGYPNENIMLISGKINLNNYINANPDL